MDPIYTSEAEKPVSVLLVDDYNFSRNALANRLEQAGFRIAGEAMDGLEGIKKAAELEPDFVVLDIAVPRLDGIETARQIRWLVPRTRILFVTGNDFPQVVREAFQAGADGYVINSDSADELLPAINSVLMGKRYVSKKLAGRAFI